MKATRAQAAQVSRRRIARGADDGVYAPAARRMERWIGLGNDGLDIPTIRLTNSHPNIRQGP